MDKVRRNGLFREIMELFWQNCLTVENSLPAKSQANQMNPVLPSVAAAVPEEDEVLELGPLELRARLARSPGPALLPALVAGAAFA